MNIDEKSRETKNKILEAAMLCFSSKDYELTGVDEICEKAGITKGAFYYHFNAKQDLLLELLNQWMQKIGNILESAKQESKDFNSIFINLPHKIRPYFEKEINQISIFLKFFIKGISDPLMGNLVKQSYKDYLDFFSGIIQEGMEADVLKKYDPRKASRILFALTVGLLIQGLIDPEGEDWESFAKECIMFFLL
ncbi:MAG: TetR/AcrR family transcriptional regulator [Actinobacteria bacterium]|nr:TetR/AcrR family transcriptional regulator [Actinomycetota bacterium]